LSFNSAVQPVIGVSSVFVWLSFV